jgi:aspartyl-tRNA(Asn)/glutamyl-tRNA(Gln) amidotransferase subunit A
MKNILSIKNNLTKENLNQQKENEINEAKKIDDVTFCTMFTGKEYENKNTDGKLFGSFYFSKDNIWTKGCPTTASSKILENFIPAEDATIIKLLNDAGAEMLGKTVLDELGMGGTGLHASTGIVYNPLDHNRIVGGSSSGSVFAMAKGLGHFALGTDTGDSIRKPASLNGIVGYKPTYGSISRYGVIPYAPSMDHVGFFTRSVADLFVLAETTFKHDKKDFTSIDNSDEYTKYINQKTRLKKVGYFGVLKNYVPKKLWDKYEEYFAELKKQNYEIVELDFRKDLLDAVAAIYMVLSFSEAVSTSANLDGMNFGLRVDGTDFEDIMKKTRAAGFGDLVKRRFIIGSYQLKSDNQIELQLKAKQIRRLIANELNKMYEMVDFIVMPPTVAKAKLISECTGRTIENQDGTEKDFLDNILVLANLSGMPSVTIPFVTEDGMPIGINLNAKIKNDADLLMFANESEEIISSMEGVEINE